jgi:hypothetical protein
MTHVEWGTENFNRCRCVGSCGRPGCAPVLRQIPLGGGLSLARMESVAAGCPESHSGDARQYVRVGLGSRHPWRSTPPHAPQGIRPLVFDIALRTKTFRFSIVIPREVAESMDPATSRRVTGSLAQGDRKSFQEVFPGHPHRVFQDTRTRMSEACGGGGGGGPVGGPDGVKRFQWRRCWGCRPPPPPPQAFVTKRETGGPSPGNPGGQWIPAFAGMTRGGNYRLPAMRSSTNRRAPA